MHIRAFVTGDRNRLTEIWRAAVEASHSFLTVADIDYYEPLVRDAYLPAVEVWVSEDARGALTGFIGLDDNKVEMLFVDPAVKGQGIGRALLDHAQKLKGRLEVDVNEQNPLALSFYLKYGFVQTARSETDGEGKPFPIIHLAQPQTCC